MTPIQCTPTQPQLIAVSRLEKSPRNARRANASVGMEELKASLLAHGLMQNLVVTDNSDGSYYVIAGGRRLAAIHSLQAEGKLPEDFAVPCQIVTEEQALEMSLAENTVRLAMHPADQFEAFAALVERGESAADVASRFGVEESLVLKRMKLARVAPQLLAEYRDDRLTLECLMAFTITDDHRRQLKIYQSLQDWQKDDPSAIRAALSEEMVEASSKLARFVSLDAYQEAGGLIRADLFGEEVYLENPALLNELAESKLHDIRHALEAEGWGWIEINPDRDWEFVNRCSRLQPCLIGAPTDLLELKAALDSELAEIEQESDETESDALVERQQNLQAQLDDVEEQLSAFVGFDTEHKSLAGCFVSIGQDGTPFVDKGLVRPEHRKQLERDGWDGSPAKVRSKNAIPESLRRDLASDRLEIAQVEIAKNPTVALDLLVYRAVSELLGRQPIMDGPHIRFTKGCVKSNSEQEPSIAATALLEIEQALPTEWLTADSEAARFEAFRSLPESAKLELLAYAVASTLRPKLTAADPDEVTAYDMALSLTGANVSDYWRPTKSNFLGRITTRQLLALGREVLGELWAQASLGLKKSLLVDQLDRAFAMPEQPGRTPHQTGNLKNYLPQGMSFNIPTRTAETGKIQQAA